jgi:glutathione synthase/RimK-type ligase-like ATP-grasp enzyme
MEKITNKRNVFLNILRKICQEQNYKMELFSQGWIVKIYQNDIVNYILAYSFGINKDASSRICADKSATSEILSLHNIPNIEHKIFHIHDDYNNDVGNWRNMINFFEEHNGKIVLKPNKGSGGDGVSFIDNLYKLECETYNAISKKSSICLAPFIEIADEYRVVMLKDKPQLIFRKRKPILKGNGKDTISTLLSDSYSVESLPVQFLETLKQQKLKLETILPINEILELSWKHNLGEGARPEIIEVDKYNKEVINIAQKTMKALGMDFASVDIIKTKNNSFKVIEVNSGIMLTNFALDSQKGYNLAKEVYSNAIQLMMQR